VTPSDHLEQNIYNFKNKGNILVVGDFNARTATKQATLLSNDSNHNPLWLDEDLVLSNSYKRICQDIIENLFGTELVKLCSSQDLIVCNGVMKWPNSNQMTSLHGLGSSHGNIRMAKLQREFPKSCLPLLPTNKSWKYKDCGKIQIVTIIVFPLIA
jgi:hypothetical protein